MKLFVLLFCLILSWNHENVIVFLISETFSNFWLKQAISKFHSREAGVKVMWKKNPKGRDSTWKSSFVKRGHFCVWVGQLLLWITSELDNATHLDSRRNSGVRRGSRTRQGVWAGKRLISCFFSDRKDLFLKKKEDTMTGGKWRRKERTKNGKKKRKKIESAEKSKWMKNCYKKWKRLRKKKKERTETKEVFDGCYLDEVEMKGRRLIT